MKTYFDLQTIFRGQRVKDPLFTSIIDRKRAAWQVSKQASQARLDNM